VVLEQVKVEDPWSTPTMNRQKEVRIRRRNIPVFWDMTPCRFAYIGIDVSKKRTAIATIIQEPIYLTTLNMDLG
jgi:hypothetical protein